MYCFPCEQNFAICSGMDAQTLLEDTLARLRKHEGNYAEIVRRYPTLGYSWLTKLAHGQITNPTVERLQTLIQALDEFEGVIREPAPEAATP